MKSSPVKGGAAWQRPDNNVGPGEAGIHQFASDGPQPTAEPVADDGSADGLRDDEAETAWIGLGS